MFSLALAAAPIRADIHPGTVRAYPGLGQFARLVVSPDTPTAPPEYAKQAQHRKGGQKQKDDPDHDPTP
jgi:hypothetical protein